MENPLQELLEIMKTHFAEDIQFLSASNAYSHTAGDHKELVQILIHHLYTNRNAFLLLLTKSQGTAFENCVDEIADMIEKSYRSMAEKTLGIQINSYMLHWMTYMNIDTFIHLLTHEPDEQRALNHMCRIMDYLIKGWQELVLTPEAEHN